MAGDEGAPRSSGCCGSCTGCCGGSSGCCGGSSGGCGGSTAIQYIILAIWTPISIALIVLGAIHKTECEAEYYIPIYMIVAGAFYLFYWVLIPLECCCPTFGKIFKLIVGLFLFAWFIAGSVWVFRIYPDFNRNCHRQTYLYVFSILIIQWIFILLGVIGIVLTCLCCQNTCASKICGRCQSLLQCCECCSCLQSCNCLESCNCLQSCSCLESCCSPESCCCLKCCSCLKCSSCLDSGCGCMKCCDVCKSLCCCCKSIQCCDCLNCSMCARCCQCLECCDIKA